MPSGSDGMAPRVPGQAIGPYQLVELIGSGGMGEVWSARDTRLDRTIALKFSSTDFSDRSAREARSVAALNHPGICTLHDVGPNYLVMEFIEGRTLDRLIPRKGLPVGDALRYAVAIADAVAAAHAQGIVHRDLKPSNVMVTPQGRIKVLDFGLAKLAAGGALSTIAPDRESATTLAAETDRGTIVGTVPYMSPEQAQGLPVDARSDIFSFGALLYEMLTGQKAFTGDTKVAILAAVVNQDPRPARDLADLPPELDRILGRCLRKDPNRRPQTMSDLHVALLELKEDSDSGRLSTAGAAVAVPAGRRHRSTWLWSAIAAASAVAAGASWWALGPRPPEEPAARTVVRATNYAGRQGGPALSPDGNQLAFFWSGEKDDNFDIYVKFLDQAETLHLTTDPAPDLMPTWSPDGKRIAFRRGDDVYTISALGGSERRIGIGLPNPQGAVGGNQLSWSPDGKWLAAATPKTGILALPAEGGDARALTVTPVAPERQLSPAFSPDGRTLAFLGCGASTVSCRIFLQPLGPGLEPDGPPRRLFDKPFRVGGGLAWSGDGRRLIFWGSSSQSGNGALWQVSVTTGEPPARLEPAVPASVGGVSIAGERVAFVRVLGGAQVWQAVEGQAPEALIRSAVWDFGASLSPDGRRIAFQSNRGGEGDEIYAANSDGTGVARLTGDDVIHAANPVWSPDGKWLAFQNQREDGNFDIVVMDSAGGPMRRLTTGNNNTTPNVSRDGSRVWFVSNRTGRQEIWHVPFGGGPEVRFTFEGRRAPQESPDGRTLYCLDASGTLYARPIAGGPERRVLSGVVGYAPVDDGLYIVKSVATGETPALHFIPHSGGPGRLVSDVPGYYVLDRAFLSVSADRRRILYSTFANVGAVIEMIEGFR
jgi:Tol biopolymer transport system component